MIARQPSCSRIPHGPTGFTLLELVAALAVVAISLTLAVPSFREIMARSTTTTIANDLVGAFAQARAEAAKRGVQVAVLGAGGGADWSSGWGVYADSGRDGAFATRVAAHGAVADGYAVRAGGGASANRVVFGVQGELVGAASVDVNVCRSDRNAAKSRFIQVRASGIVVARRDTRTSAAPSC